MRKRLDLSGKKFGSLTAIKEVGKNKHGKRLWECRCECGNTTVAQIDNLTCGGTTSCGCSRRLDISGKKFGSLIAIKEVGKDKWGARIWECRCECGNTTEKLACNLVRGKTPSCGCMKYLPAGEASFNKLYARYRRQAKKRNHKFELTKDQFKEITSSDCAYCGQIPTEQPDTNRRLNGTYKYNGIDRLDNSFGYVEGNVVPCCKFCNYAKGQLTEKEFLDQITKIYERSCK